MTVKEMFEKKYREKMATITEREWAITKASAQYRKMHVAKFIMLGFDISEKDFNDNGIYYYGGELETLHKLKYIASNRHRQEHGHITYYWLTEKGYKQLFV